MLLWENDGRVGEGGKTIGVEGEEEDCRWRDFV